jgi:hypothetical protein
MIINRLQQHWTMCRLINSEFASQRQNAKLYFQAQAGLARTALARKAVTYAQRRIA